MKSKVSRPRRGDGFNWAKATFFLILSLLIIGILFALFAWFSVQSALSGFGDWQQYMP